VKIVLDSSLKVEKKFPDEDLVRVQLVAGNGGFVRRPLSDFVSEISRTFTLKRKHRFSEEINFLSNQILCLSVDVFEISNVTTANKWI
jgi:hypothetical protein